jgi:hypothetical protein
MDSSDGLFYGKIANVLMKKLFALAAELAEKGRNPAPKWLCGHVNARMSVAVIVRTTHLCLRGHRIPPSKMSKSLLQWEDKAGLAGMFPHQWQLPF